MTYGTKNGTVAVKAISAVLFLTFVFCYLYFYQADILAVSQHVLSGGKTFYEPTIGAVLITLALYLLQIGVYALTKIEGRAYALTYFPSILILTVLTSLQPDCNKSIAFGAWWIVFPLLLLLYAGGGYVIRQCQTCHSYHRGAGWMSKVLWCNVLTLSGMFVFAGLCSNSNDVYHYRMKAERCLMRHDWDGAALVGRKSLATDSSLTMLRAYALAKQGLLGEYLFNYPVIGNSRVLLPDSQTVKLMMLQEKYIYHDLGIRLRQQLSPRKYLDFIDRHNIAKPMGHEYLLTAYLLDKDLDGFVRKIGKYYELNDSLPKHYREALTLYTHLHSVPYVVYHNTVMDADYQDFQKLCRSEADTAIRKTKLKDTYGNTYWYYYQYGE